jgi:putative salt-induced outer membrane protein
MRLTTFVLIVLGWASVVQAQPAPDAEVRAAEERLGSALAARDAGAVQQLLAEDFVQRAAPDMARAAWIERALKLCWGDQVSIGDFRVVRLSPDGAVVTLVLTTSRDPVTCAPATMRTLLTDLWRREQDGWKLALRHAGPPGPSLDAQFEKVAAPPPPFEGTAELSLVSTGGNSDTESLGAGASMIWRPGKWTTHGQVSFIRSEASDVETARSLVASVRQGRAITPRLDLFGRFEYLVNEFAGIENRLTVDGGVGYKAVDDAVHFLRLDAGIGYSHEARLAADDLDTALTNLGGLYRWRFHPSATAENAALFTASFDRGADWRFRNAAAVTAAMTRLLSLKVSHEFKYVNDPVPGFEKTDRILSAAVVVGF